MPLPPNTFTQAIKLLVLLREDFGMVSMNLLIREIGRIMFGYIGRGGVIAVWEEGGAVGFLGWGGRRGVICESDGFGGVRLLLGGFGRICAKGGAAEVVVRGTG